MSVFGVWSSCIVGSEIMGVLVINKEVTILVLVFCVILVIGLLCAFYRINDFGFVVIVVIMILVMRKSSFIVYSIKVIVMMMVMIFIVVICSLVFLLCFLFWFFILIAYVILVNSNNVKLLTNPV